MSIQPIDPYLKCALCYKPLVAPGISTICKVRNAYRHEHCSNGFSDKVVYELHGGEEWRRHRSTGQAMIGSSLTTLFASLYFLPRAAHSRVALAACLTTSVLSLKTIFTARSFLEPTIEEKP